MEVRYEATELKWAEGAYSCKTPCIYKRNTTPETGTTKIGSTACIECKYHGGIDRENKIVTCHYDERKKAKKK